MVNFRSLHKQSFGELFTKLEIFKTAHLKRLNLSTIKEMEGHGNIFLKVLFINKELPMISFVIAVVEGLKQSEQIILEEAKRTVIEYTIGDDIGSEG